MPYSASELASFVDRDIVGEDVEVENVNSIERAMDGEMAYLGEEYPYDLDDSDASVVVCSPSASPRRDRTLILSETPRNTFMKIVDEFFVPEPEETTIHPTAVVEDGAEIGANCIVEPHVYVHENVTIGDGCILRAGCVVGTSGWTDERDESGRLLRRVDRGDVIIGDDVIVRANSVILRATFEETVIGRGSRIAESVVIGHGDRIGEDVGILGQCWLSGSVTIEDRARLEPAACVANHTTVGEEALVGMNSTVLEDVAPGETVVGSPARPIE